MKRVRYGKIPLYKEAYWTVNNDPKTTIAMNNNGDKSVINLPHMADQHGQEIITSVQNIVYNGNLERNPKTRVQQNFTVESMGVLLAYLIDPHRGDKTHVPIWVGPPAEELDLTMRLCYLVKMIVEEL